MSNKRIKRKDLTFYPKKILTRTVVLSDDETDNSSSVQDTLFEGVAGEAITEGDPLMLGTDGEIYVMEAKSTYYNQFIGIAYEDAADTERIRIVREGRFTSSNYSFTVDNDAPIVVRDPGELSETLLTAINGSEDMYVEVAKAISSNTIELLNTPKYYIYL